MELNQGFRVHQFKETRHWTHSLYPPGAQQNWIETDARWDRISLSWLDDQLYQGWLHWWRVNDIEHLPQQWERLGDPNGPIWEFQPVKAKQIGD